MAPKKEISLLPDKENPNSLFGRIMVWLTTVGRYVIVFTELLVISGFLSRFWLDRANSDLSEALRQKSAIVEAAYPFEISYLALQEKLKVIKTVYSSRPDIANKIILISENTPPEIIFQSLNADNNKGQVKLNINVLAYSETAIVNFVYKLSGIKSIETVDVRNIEKKSKENKYTVNLEIIFKNDATKNTKSN